MSWCLKCHYGSDTMVIRDLENWKCPNCNNTGATNKNPFSEINPKDRRTLRDTRKERAAKYNEKVDKFNFNEKDIQQPLQRII